jgi:hypothetical protein
MMNSSGFHWTMIAVAVAALLHASLALADSEVTDSQGRRILLKDDGTWKVIDEGKAKPDKPEVRAELSLVRAVGTPGSCTLDLSLKNLLPYEIRTLVVNLAAVKADDVVYRSQLADFITIRPGDSRQRSVRFDGIACPDVAKIRVSGGDRCEMGELNRFSEAKGACLALVNVLPSSMLKFEK